MTFWSEMSIVITIKVCKNATLIHFIFYGVTAKSFCTGLPSCILLHFVSCFFRLFWYHFSTSIEIFTVTKILFWYCANTNKKTLANPSLGSSSYFIICFFFDEDQKYPLIIVVGVLLCWPFQTCKVSCKGQCFASFGIPKTVPACLG